MNTALQPTIEDLLEDQYEDPRTHESVRLQPIRDRYGAVMRQERALAELERQLERHQADAKAVAEQIKAAARQLRGIIADPNGFLPFPEPEAAAAG